MAISAFLFDLDGTLWNSFPCYAAALQHACNAEVNAVLKDLRNGENLINLAREQNVTDSALRKSCINQFSPETLTPGALNTLRELQRRRIPLGIVTNLPKRLVDPLLAKTGIESFFGAVIGNARKPSGRGILKACADLNVEPSLDCVYVGDTETDARAAAAAGVSFIHASFGHGGRSSDGIRTVRSFAQILTV